MTDSKTFEAGLTGRFQLKRVAASKNALRRWTWFAIDTADDSLLGWGDKAFAQRLIDREEDAYAEAQS